LLPTLVKWAPVPTCPDSTLAEMFAAVEATGDDTIEPSLTG